jgi:hypothetical protein
LHAIIALLVFIRGWDIVRIGEASFYVFIFVTSSVRPVVLPLLRGA